MEAHPYSPKDLTLLGFVPNFMSQMTILGIFAAASIIVLTLAWTFPGNFPSYLVWYLQRQFLMFVLFGIFKFIRMEQYYF